MVTFVTLSGSTPLGEEDIMANIRPLPYEEFLRVFMLKRYLQKPLEEVKAAVDGGSRLEMEESGFKDPGPDYCAVLLDGQRIAVIPGY